MTKCKIERCIFLMEAIEIVEELIKKYDPYKSTIYLLKRYKDLKKGKDINVDYRSVVLLMEKVISMIEDDEYIDIVKCLYIEGLTFEETAEKVGIDRSTLYRNHRRLVRRISIIIYGDRALI